MEGILEIACIVATNSYHGSTMAHVYSVGGCCMRLEGSADGAPGNAVTLSDPITQVRIRAPGQHATGDSGAKARLSCACWDAFSGCVYAVMGEAVVRVAESGDATVVAGHPREAGQTDGAGLSARFHHCTDITSDSRGSLFVVDNGWLRRLQLPTAASWVPAPAPVPFAAAVCSCTRGGDDKAPQQH